MTVVMTEAQRNALNRRARRSIINALRPKYTSFGVPLLRVLPPDIILRLIPLQHLDLRGQQLTNLPEEIIVETHNVIPVQATRPKMPDLAERLGPYRNPEYGGTSLARQAAYPGRYPSVTVVRPT
jgi:hypothetical protein